MSECIGHEHKRRLGSPCPYCVIERLTAERDTAEANLERLQNKFEAVTGENDRLNERIAELEAAIKDLFAMMDERLLVRNIENDSDPLWALHALNFTRRLAEVQQALAKGGNDSE